MRFVRGKKPQNSKKTATISVKTTKSNLNGGVLACGRWCFFSEAFFSVVMRAFAVFFFAVYFPLAACTTPAWSSPGLVANGTSYATGTTTPAVPQTPPPIVTLQMKILFDFYNSTFGPSWKVKGLCCSFPMFFSRAEKMGLFQPKLLFLCRDHMRRPWDCDTRFLTFFFLKKRFSCQVLLDSIFEEQSIGRNSASLTWTSARNRRY